MENTELSDIELAWEEMQHGNSRGRQDGIGLDRNRVAVDHWLSKSVSQDGDPSSRRDGRP